MPWIRFKRYQYLTPLAPHVAICGSGRRYVWTGAQAGAVCVPYKTDIAWLLNPPGEAESSYELAYERHGIAFDANGKESEAQAGANEKTPPPPPPSAPPGASGISNLELREEAPRPGTSIRRGPGRPPKPR